MELLRQGRTEELWQRYLGYLDLTLDEFMNIQNRKVMEHISWMQGSQLGHRIIGSKLPSSVDEFRATVPMTTYADYAPFLLERKNTACPRSLSSGAAPRDAVVSTQKSGAPSSGKRSSLPSRSML